jgi:hypothetical protein
LPKIFVILLFAEKIRNKSTTLRAPKLYHNFAARVKNYFLGVFPDVVFMQPGTILAPQRLARFLLLANSMPMPNANDSQLWMRMIRITTNFTL